MSAMRRRVGCAALRAAEAVALAVCLGGCATGYVLRAGYEEMRILWRRRPIETVLAEEPDPETRAKLELTLAVRAFARDRVGLAVRGSYASLARVDDAQVVHLVTASRRDRLEPVTWWFPIVGRVPYRSYFDPADAHDLAADLEGDGYDTYVRPAVAFSTLGWFDDPLLSTLLRFDDVYLADIVIHELLHNTVYLAGHTAFDESFANFVGCQGAVEFFVARADERSAERARDLCADQLEFSRFLGDLSADLERAYAAGIDETERQARFRVAQDAFRQRAWRTRFHREFGIAPLNNAIIVHHRLYAQRLDLFARAFASQERDLARTVTWVADAARSTDDPFAALARALDSSDPAAGRLSE